MKPHLNVETEPSMQWHGDWETESMENMHQPLCILKYRKIIPYEYWMEKWPPISEKNYPAKFQITNATKVWVSTFPSVDRNGKLSLAIMKKLKNGCNLWRIVVQQNSKLLIPQKFGFLLFLVSMETENWHQPLWENSHHFARNHCTMKFQITDCPQRLALCFS